ncbi:hypothetical protein BGZ51_002726 [Haplosporangium sp. Z 767]|nr:hypothetical protein BGZ50_008118 [Haplosporangium sp. Z 11]KAF9185302.1 hypothetical protein BGZ51_002726 [Haplosporangium sp. Z 767]
MATPTPSPTDTKHGSSKPQQLQHQSHHTVIPTTSSQIEPHLDHDRSNNNNISNSINDHGGSKSLDDGSPERQPESVSESIAPTEQGPERVTGILKTKVSWKSKAWDIWMKNWFLLGLIVVIILARYFPGWGRTGGPIRPEYSVKYGITSCIFLLSGLSLKTKDLLTSAMNYRAHLLIQLTSFIVIPLFVKAITALIGLSNMNATLLAGMAITSATPTTISSNVVMTANSDGNESLALFNAALGNLLGVFISPLIVLILLHSTPQTPSGQHGLDYATILRDLGTTILVPIVVGQVYLYFFPKSIAWAKKKVHFPTLNSSCLLILVWTVFCDAFYKNTFSSVSAGEIIAIGALQGVTFWIMTFFLGFVARVRPSKIRILKIMETSQQERVRREAQLEQQPDQEEGTQDAQRKNDASVYTSVTEGLSLPRTVAQRLVEPMSKQDTVAVLFCGATKSVAMGIPMIKILYSGSDGSAMAGLLATPLLIYHVEQLFSGAFMVGWLKKWVGRGEETLASFAAKKNRKQDQPQEQGQEQEPIRQGSSVLSYTSTKASFKDNSQR